MSNRQLWLAAYDISRHKRRAAALTLVRGYATGGQKSVHEVFLDPVEQRELLHDMSLILDDDTDRFLLLRLDPRSKVLTAGIAERPADPAFFYLG